MAAKAHLRNGRPLLLALSTNDALSNSARSIGQLLGEKNVYFVPFRQDAPFAKPASMVADMTLLAPAALQALEGRQIQPVILAPVL
jgi:dipicolinate synthase subunit B